MAEIRVPVTAPGATEAAAEVRTFGKAVAEEGVVAEKAAAANTKLGTARKSVGASATEAATASERHSTALAKEVARLKLVEEQAHITRMARKQLGESVDAGDVGALRRFARALPGGMGKELGRGLSEGVEGAQGSGLRGALGVGGAGLAAGMIGFEVFNKAMEMSAEAAHQEMEARIHLADFLRDEQKTAGGLGADAQSKFGDAILKLQSLGGSGAVQAALKSAHANGDTSAIGAYADAYQRFRDPGLRDKAISAAEMESHFGIRDMGAAMKGFNESRLSRAYAKGGGGGLSLLREDGAQEGTRMTEAQLSQMMVNMRQPNETADAIRRNRQLSADTDLAKIAQIPAAEGGLREAKADALNPGAAAMIGENQKTALADADLSHAMERKFTGGSPATAWLGGMGNALVTAYDRYFSKGSGSSAKQLGIRADEKMEMAEKLRSLGTAAHEAAGALEGGGGNDAAPQAAVVP